jgi:hypothetical protein
MGANYWKSSRSLEEEGMLGDSGVLLQSIFSAGYFCDDSIEMYDLCDTKEYNFKHKCSVSLV